MYVSAANQISEVNTFETEFIKYSLAGFTIINSRHHPDTKQVFRQWRLGELMRSVFEVYDWSMFTKLEIGKPFSTAIVRARQS